MADRKYNQEELDAMIDRLDVVTRLLEDADREGVNPDDYEAQFEDCFGEIVNICGYGMNSIDILRTMDPIAYRAALLDYCDGLSVQDEDWYIELTLEKEELEEILKPFLYLYGY